jgi:hypothetical protein
MILGVSKIPKQKILSSKQPNGSICTAQKVIYDGQLRFLDAAQIFQFSAKVISIFLATLSTLQPKHHLEIQFVTTKKPGKMSIS